MPQFDRDKDHLVKREEDRDLHQDWQTARGRVHFILLIKLHHALLHLLAVIARVFLELFHFWLQLFHFGHRHVGLIRQRQEDRLDDQGQTNDRPPHVADKLVQLMKQPKDGFRKEKEPTPVDAVDEL